MPDFERLTDKLGVDLAATEGQKQYALGYIAGKKRARNEVLVVMISLYFAVVLIGKMAGGA